MGANRHDSEGSMRNWFIRKGLRSFLEAVLLRLLQDHVADKAQLLP